MKAIFILLLISLASCININEKIECFTKSENFFKEILKVVDSFKTADMNTIFITIISAYFSIKDEIQDCLNGEPNLKMTYCGYKCSKAVNKPECIILCEKGEYEIVKVEPLNITNIIKNEN